MPPTQKGCQLVDGRTVPPSLVAALVLRDFAPSRLLEVERTWRPARYRADLIAPTGLQHGHWNWTNKIATTEVGHHRLVAVECEDAIQGLMAVLTKNGPILQGGHPGPILYVDYLEAAPWNLRDLDQRPRYLGVGTNLIAEAVRLRNYPRTPFRASETLRNKGVVTVLG